LNITPCPENNFSAGKDIQTFFMDTTMLQLGTIFQLGQIKDKVGQYLISLDRTQRDKAAELTKYELRELENIFVLLTIGSFVGLPAPPSFVSIELLPYLEHELEVLNERAKNSSDALAELMGNLDID
jgi:hypothetical protein